MEYNFPIILLCKQTFIKNCSVSFIQDFFFFFFFFPNFTLELNP